MIMLDTHDKRLARFGLSYHPFSTPQPASCQLTAEMTHFLTRCDHLVGSGGFALITGDPGTGKTTLLRCLHARLKDTSELVTGVVTRPQASLADFYRELGALFGVALSPHNRWAGSGVLRERWLAHWGTSHQRPVLIIDEAQELNPMVLGELRLLVTADLDAVSLVSVILAGDGRLNELLHRRELAPVLSRVRMHHRTTTASMSELTQLLDHLLTRSGNPQLMTDGLKRSMVEHASGNRRSLMYLGEQLMEAALADPTCSTLDEPLFIRLVRPPTAGATAAPGRARKTV